MQASQFALYTALTSCLVHIVALLGFDVVFIIVEQLTLSEFHLEHY